MDILDVLDGSGSMSMRGELTQERAHIAQFVCDANVSLIRVGLTAAKTFGRDIPDNIGHEIRTAIKTLDGTMARYLDNAVDAATMKVAIRQAQGKAAQIHESLRKETGAAKESTPKP
jgi:hypothetical protein